MVPRFLVAYYDYAPRNRETLFSLSRHARYDHRNRTASQEAEFCGKRRDPPAISMEMVFETIAKLLQ